MPYVITTSHESLPCFARALLLTLFLPAAAVLFMSSPQHSTLHAVAHLAERITAMGVLQGLKHLSGIVGTGSGGGYRERK